MNTRSASLLVLTVALLGPAASFAQPSSPSPAAPTTTQQAQPVPDHYSLPSDKLARATTLYHTDLTMFVLSTIYGFVVLWALLHYGVGVRFRDLAERVS